MALFVTPDVVSTAAAAEIGGKTSDPGGGGLELRRSGGV